MRKKILLVITVLLLASACSSNLKSINLKKLNQKLDNKEAFILYLTNEDEYGTTLKNTLYKVAKDNNLETYYINTDKIKESELADLKELFYFDETNIVIFVKDGNENTVLSRIDDPYISVEKLETELKNQGYLK